MKRLFSLLLCLLLVLSLPLPVTAEEAQPRRLLISDEARFLQFAEKCRLDSYSMGLAVSLEADLDLTGVDFSGIPIFCGSFDGNGHTISGLSITAEGSYLGLFRYLTEDASVEHLHVRGAILPEGSASHAGSIAGSNAGTIVNCSFDGNVSGADYIGGLVGENTLTGVIEDCSVKGSLYGNHFVGGIAGSNQGVIRSCANQAQVNTTSQQNSVSVSDITMESLTSAEAANTVTDVGGIAGQNGGVIRSCVNRGDIGYRQMGYNIGGIAGSQTGHIRDCENRGTISGRKEVGGIVGQMEPTALIEYTQDALQILQEQLDEMGKIAGQAAANAQATAAQIGTQAESVQWYIEDASNAVEQLLKGEDGSLIPDKDSLQAAQNVLGNSFAGMTQALQGMRATAQSAVGTLSNNISALQRQLEKMQTTLDNASETLGGSIEDVSDMDTEDDLSGKVSGCVNYGDVLADINVGGIAGAMALENDLDPEEDFSVTGENSLNFESRLRVVILDCENRGTVTVKKQNGGGITGWMQFGLVKNCRNVGALLGENAYCVGGIAGQSSCYIRESYSKCSISGHIDVGGIAGKGAVVTDCRSMVQLSGTERLGAVLGSREEYLVMMEQEDAAVSGNYYLVIRGDPGGIDGISYAGLAESLPEERFLNLENLPQMFRTITVRFVYEDGGSRTVVLEPGAVLEEDQIPPLPEKEGFSGVWEGLETLDTTFDAEIRAVYTPYATTVASELARNGRSIVLVEGTFDADVRVAAQHSEKAPALTNRQKLLEVIAVELEPAPENAVVRCLLPEDWEEELLLFTSADGSTWEQTSFVVDGSYLVFSMPGGSGCIAIVQQTPVPWLLLACGAAGIGLLTAGCILYRKKRKTAKSPKTV